MSKKKLLINCDDLGMHPSINRAIVKLLSQGLIRSASILPVAPHFDHALELLRAAKISSIGVHLSLSAEYGALPFTPAMNPSSIPSLVDEKGHFFPQDKNRFQCMNLSEVERELDAQIRKVLESGFSLTHLDGHMFFYSHEESGENFFEIVQKLGRNYQLPVRGQTAFDFRYIWEGVDNRKERFRFYDQFLSQVPDAPCELLIHPGDSLAEMSEFTGAGERRYSDFLYFSSPAFTENLEKNGIQVVGWPEIVSGEKQ